MTPVIEYYENRKWRIRYGKAAAEYNMSEWFQSDIWGYHIEKKGWFGYYSHGFQPSLQEARDDLRRQMNEVTYEEDFDD